MSRETLGIYLNDHLTGSVFAVETLERLLSGNHPALPKEALQGLLSEIEADRDVLRGLLEKAEVEEHLVKKAAAWLTEKLGRMKLDEGPLGRMEMLETLALGISGKLKLWVALEHVAPRYPELAGVDYPGLQARAREQHDLVEDLRIKAALLVL
jgi:hypothetical protein